MKPPRIHAVRLPANAWRRTWLASAAREYLPPVDFRALLREIAPARWRRMPAAGRSMIDCYRELLRDLDARFPVDPMAFENFEAGIVEPGFTTLWWDGVPIQPCGLPEEDDYSAPATAVCVAYAMSSAGAAIPGLGIYGERDRGENIRSNLASTEALAPFAGELAGWFSQGNRHIENGTLASPGRGRRWISPWDGLQDLYDWATHSTGYGWLDASPLDIYEGDDWPAWNADEIRAIDASWRECQPAYQRAVLLQEHIDRDPNPNVPLLAGALRGDRDILSQLSRPARGQPARGQPARSHR